MLNRLFSAPSYSTPRDAALLLLRFVVGAAFMFHGWGKIQNPFAWMGPQGAPAPLQALAALSEFGGGFALIIGLLTSLAALGIAFVMATAFAMHAFMRGDPFVNASGGASYELAAVYLFIAIAFITFGPGKFSLDRAIFGPKT